MGSEEELKSIKSKLEGMETDFKKVSSFCEQFPQLCSRVDKLESHQHEPEEETEEEKEVSPEEALRQVLRHRRLCKDGVCNAAVDGALESFGYVDKAKVAPPKQEIKEPEPDSTPAPKVEKLPWEVLGIEQKHYEKHPWLYKDDLDEALKEKGE